MYSVAGCVQVYFVAGGTGVLCSRRHAGVSVTNYIAIAPSCFLLHNIPHQCILTTDKQTTIVI